LSSPHFLVSIQVKVEMIMLRQSFILLFAGLAIPASPTVAQTANPAAFNSLTSINNGEVSSQNTTSNVRIEGGEFNSISATAQGAQSSVKTTEIVSITPDLAGSTGAQTGGGGNMIVGTTSTTTNNGTVRNKGSFAGVVMYGDRNSMSISASGAGTSYSITTSTPGSTPGSTPSTTARN
jgi:hypothetical protein